MTSAALDHGRLVVHGPTGKRSRLCDPVAAPRRGQLDAAKASQRSTRACAYPIEVVDSASYRSRGRASERGTKQTGPEGSARLLMHIDQKHPIRAKPSSRAPSWHRAVR
jgi:hypothetical protein